MERKILLVLDNFSLEKARKYGCTSLVVAYKEDARTDTVPCGMISTLQWDKTKYSQDDYMHQLYAELGKFWLKAASLIWSYENILISSPVLKYPTNEAYEEFLYKRIEHYPFLHNMLLSGSEVRLVITGLQLHSPVHTP